MQHRSRHRVEAKRRLCVFFHILDNQIDLTCRRCAYRAQQPHVVGLVLVGGAQLGRMRSRQPQANKGGGMIYNAMQCKFAYIGVYTHSTCMHGGRKHKHARRLVDKLSLIPFFQFSIVLHVYIFVYLHTHLWSSIAENCRHRRLTVALVIARASPRHRHGIPAAAGPNRHTTLRPSKGSST